MSVCVKNGSAEYVEYTDGGPSESRHVQQTLSSLKRSVKVMWVRVPILFEPEACPSGA
jgi:hypothetical protein